MGGSNASGGSRKSHTKSRKGCKTCKRRHIRCDETFPQCRNCSKHNVRCDYMDSPIPGEDESTSSPPTPSLMEVGQDLGSDLELWHQSDASEVSDIPSFSMTYHLMPKLHTSQDMFLMHHIQTLVQHMRFSDPNQYALWTRQIPLLRFVRIAVQNDFVMRSILALSASHMSWVSNNSQLMHVSYHHRGLALQGLQQAIGCFSRQNSDAVLAASILLSWQANDWRSWKSLVEGTSTVVQAMQSWKHESDFAEYMGEFDLVRSPAQQHRFIAGPEESKRILHQAHVALQVLEPFVRGKEDETRALEDLTAVVRTLMTMTPFTSEEVEFELIHPLRAWMFFLPVSFLGRMKRDPNVMVLLANFYGLLLAIEPLFPGVECSYFGAMSVASIEEIQRLVTVRRNKAHDDPSVDNWDWIARAMTFPLEQLASFKSRNSWVGRMDALDPATAAVADLDSQIDFEQILYDPRPSFQQKQEFMKGPMCSDVHGYDVNGFPGMHLRPPPPAPSPLIAEEVMESDQLVALHGGQILSYDNLLYGV